MCHRHTDLQVLFRHASSFGGGTFTTTTTLTIVAKVEGRLSEKPLLLVGLRLRSWFHFSLATTFRFVPQISWDLAMQMGGKVGGQFR